MANSDTPDVIISHSGFLYEIMSMKDGIYINAFCTKECFLWQIYINLDCSQMPDPFSPRVIYDIFDDYKKGKLGNDVKINFPISYRDVTKPLRIDIIYMMKFYDNINEKGITIPLQHTPLSPERRLKWRLHFRVRGCLTTPPPTTTLDEIVNQYLDTDVAQYKKTIEEHEATIKNLQKSLVDHETTNKQLQDALASRIEIPQGTKNETNHIIEVSDKDCPTEIIKS